MSEGEILKRLAEDFAAPSDEPSPGKITVKCRGCNEPVSAAYAAFRRSLCGKCFLRIAAALDQAALEQLEESKGK